MEMLSAFKNESEFMMYNQTVPIKKTETFQEDMMSLVQHLLFSLKNRKTRINDVAAFFHKLGIEWNDHWIPFILDHKLLFAKTECKPLNVMDRLIVELDIVDQRLVDPLLEMTHDDEKPYVVYLVESLKSKQLHQHYRLMTSGFIIRKYCKEINSSWLKWEPNNKMNAVLGLGVSDVDHSCFADAEYQINGQLASPQTNFFADQVLSLTVRHPHFFGERSIPIHEQSVQVIPGKEYVPHDIRCLLKIDGYSNGCVVVDDIPPPDHIFRVGQKVKCSDDWIGKINRVFADSVCIKSVAADICCFRWVESEEYPTELTLEFSSQRKLDEYDFAIKKGQKDQSRNLASAPKYKIASINDFQINSSAMMRVKGTTFIGVYVQRKNDEEYKWGRLRLIKCPPREEMTKNSKVTEDAGKYSVEKMVSILQNHPTEIIEREYFLDEFGLHSSRFQDWAPSVIGNPGIFAVTRYRRKLVIERLIVELNLWSTEWIHRILEEEIKDKSMLQWLVEDRRVRQLHDHYRIYMSHFTIKYCEVLNCRWFAFQKDRAMSGKAGFDDFADRCFLGTQHYIDGKSLSSTVTSAFRGEVHRISATNTVLFGDQPIVIQDLNKDGNDEHVPHLFSDTLKMDAYSNDDIFVDDIPSKTYPFRIGQRLRCNDGMVGVITRLTADGICIKVKCGVQWSFHWIHRVEAPKEIRLEFQDDSSISGYTFTVTMEKEKPSNDIPSDDMYTFSYITSFLIPSRKMKLGNVSFQIYAKPKTGDCDWVHIKTIDCSSNFQSALDISPGIGRGESAQVSVDRLMMIMEKSDFAIRGGKRLLRALRLQKKRKKQWLPLIAAHPLFFAVTAYRRKLVIERLVVELQGWSSDWTERVTETKKDGKSMLQWLVEDRKLTQLYDQYRICMSIAVRSSALLRRRWLKFKRQTKMSGTTGFDDSDKSCFQMTSYEADGTSITAKTTSLTDNVREIKAKNAKLFGSHAISMQQFEDMAGKQQIFNDFVAALKIDQYSNGCVFVDDIPSTKYSFHVGQEVVIDDGAKGVIMRVTSDDIFVKIANADANLISFRWISKMEAPKLIALKFQDEDDLSNFNFAVIIGEDEDSINFSELKHHQFSDVKDYLIPCPGLSSYESDVAAIGIYAKPRSDGYGWARIKTIKYPSVTEEVQTLPAQFVDARSKGAVGQLITSLLTTSYEIRDPERMLLSMGLDSEQSTEWISSVDAHPQLFDVTTYRRRLVIERLMVELKILRVQWVHRILEQKMKNKPMLQWLVEDRRVPLLHDHYRVYMSRFTVTYSALLNRRWLKLQRNTKMKGKPGFGNLDNSCFQFTTYHADGDLIAPNIPAVAGHVREITITNNELFGNRSVVLQKFDVNGDDHYMSDDFSDALRFADGHVFLNHIPSESYTFCIGQEVECNDGSFGLISRITDNGVCVKFMDDNDQISFRWFAGSRIAMELTMRFRYKKDIVSYYFAVSVRRGNTKNLSSREFQKIEAFKIDCESLNLYAGDQIYIYAKPQSGGYKWNCIKCLDPSQNSDENAVKSGYRNQHSMSINVDDLVVYLRKRFSRIEAVEDKMDILDQFGLRMEQRTEWMSLIAANSALFSITAYQSMLLVERLIVELNLLDTQLVLRILGETKNGNSMLRWLVENRKVQRLYDHYRVCTSGFKLVYHSEIMSKTWLRFERNVTMAEEDGFKDADDLCVNNTLYFIDEKAYPMDTDSTTLCVSGYPRLTCRNIDLFGQRDIDRDHESQNGTGKQLKMRIMRRHISPIPIVENKTPKSHVSWFQKAISSKTIKSLPLKLYSHRNHFEHPNALLQSGRSSYYEGLSGHPVNEDWIVFAQWGADAVPTEIIILNYEDSYGLKEMKIFGSAGDDFFEEWIQISNIRKSREVLQCFTLDPASVHYAWRRGFRYFRLCSMQTHGDTMDFIKFYHFGINGVKIRLQSHNPVHFADMLSIDNENKIILETKLSGNLDFKRNFEVLRDGKWIQGFISRVLADRICVKTFDGALVSFQWIYREDISSNIRYSVPNRTEVPKHLFAATLGSGKAGPVFSDTFSFENASDFVIPLDKLASLSQTPDTVSIYGKPKRNDCNFQFFKTIKCSEIAPSMFVVDNTFDINRRFEINSFVDTTRCECRFDVFASADITISSGGTVNAFANTESDECKSAHASIHLISGGDVVNEGNLRCRSSNGGGLGEMSVYVNSDGLFENTGTIDCGDVGVVTIECTHYQNYGVIIPEPKVIYKNRNSKTNRQLVKLMIAPQRQNRGNIKLIVSDHRGNYGSDHPKGLLLDGTDQYYDSDGKGPPAEDWIIFGTLSKTKVFPTSIAIKNRSNGYGLKTIQFEGSADGIKFDEWIKIDNISREHEDLQIFPVDQMSGYLAWERAYIFFKLKVVENHGGSYNKFYEFRIDGMEVK